MAADYAWWVSVGGQIGIQITRRLAHIPTFSWKNMARSKCHIHQQKCGEFRETDGTYCALLWQREATLENGISRKWAKYNVSVIYIDFNPISWCLDLNIFQRDECFCSMLGLEMEHATSNLKTPISQIWVICHLLPFVRVGQNTFPVTNP